MGAREAEVPKDRRIAYRVGINLGEIVIDGEDILGDGVNVAARLEGLAEPGGIRISDVVFKNVKGKLDLGFADLGPQQVKNIAEPVPTYRVLLDPADVGKYVAAKRRRPTSWRWAAGAVAAVLLLAAAGLAWWQPWAPDMEPARPEHMAYPLPDKPSIAVLPFTNMSDDSSQDYFTDGMTEDLITDLSKVSGLFVIARNSVFTYKGRPVKVREVAEELGVRYVLEGSVRRIGDQVRINAQLIDATTGGHLWADRYDGSLVDVFALQDKLTQKIVTALALKLTAGTQAKDVPKETDNPQAYDAFLKGWEHYRLDTPEHYAKALRYFEQAAKFDPNYDRAQAAMAFVYWKSHRQDWTAALGLGYYEARNRARELVAKVSGKPVPLAYQVASQMAVRRGRYAEAIETAEQAVGLDPNDADSQAVLAEALIYSGQPEKALIRIDNARRHDPHNESRYAFLQGLARFGMDQFAAAAVSFERTIELNPDLWNPEGKLGGGYCYPCVVLISAYGYLGRISDARALIEKVKNYWPGLSAESEMIFWSFKIGPDMVRFTGGLIKAGVPERSTAGLPIRGQSELPPLTEPKR